MEVASRHNRRRQRELATIHIAKSKLIQSGRLTEDGYRSIVAEVLADRGLPQTRSVPSSADLDAGGRSQVLAVFRDSLGWEDAAHKSRRNRAPGRYVGRGEVGESGHLTQEQADYIARLENRLGWSESPKRLLGFIERTTGAVSTVEMLSKQGASKVITGLERMTGQKPHPRSRKA